MDEIELIETIQLFNRISEYNENVANSETLGINDDWDEIMREQFISEEVEVVEDTRVENTVDADNVTE